MEIPLELFLGFIATTFIMIVIGLVRNPQIPVMIVGAGLFILTMTVIIDTVIVGYYDNIIYELLYPMNVTSGITSIQLANTNFGAGERPVNTDSALYNIEISCIMLDLSKSGSPTGTATIGILGGAGTIIKSFGTIDVSTLTTSQKSYEFCLSSHDFWQIGLYERVGIFYSGGSAGNGVNIYLDGTNPFDGSNSDRSTLSSGMTWTDVANSDLRMVLTYDKATIESLPNLFLFDNTVKVLFALLAVMIMLVGALMSRVGS